MRLDWRSRLLAFRWLPASTTRRCVALEWDAREARVVVATCGDGRATVEQAFNVPWAAEGVANNEEAMGQTLAAALASHGVKRADALMTVTRGSVELKQLTLPPAPDDELPALVRWQALRDFHALGDDWPLDFLPLPAGAEEPRAILAAALSPENLWQLVGVSRAAGLTTRSVVLRPCALAALFLRRAETRGEPVRLLIDLLADEAELTVFLDDAVVFMRTVRLSGDVLQSPDLPSHDNARPLIAEVRRTMAAVYNQLAGRRVEAIYLCGARPAHVALAERLALELQLPARTFDPWAEANAPTKLPDDSERFGALLGLLQVEAEASRHAIDFLNPRRPPAPPNPRKKYAAAAAIAALFIAAVVLGVRQRLTQLDLEIADLQRTNQKLDELLKRAAPIERSVQALELWNRTDVVWLDELHWLTEHFPPAQDAMLTQIRLGPTTGQQAAGGLMELEGAVRVATVVDALEQQLRDAHHGVDGHGRQQDRDRKSYAWQFKSSVTVQPNATQPPTGQDR